MRTVWLLLAALPLQAAAENGLEGAFTGPVRAGEPATLAITLTARGCHPDTSYEWWHAHEDGSVLWGDGEGFEWLDVDSDWGGFLEDHPTHTYNSPGRYRVVLGYRCHFNCLPPPCQGGGWTLRDTLTVDVEPNPELTPDGWLGTFFDPEGTVCGETVLPGTIIYAVAGLAGRSSIGVVGAEFRLSSWQPRFSEPQFSFLVQTLPGWIRVGDPFGDGVILAGVCTPNPEVDRVPLLKLIAMPLVGDAYTNLFFERHRNPTNAIYEDAMLILCDDPTYTAIPAGKGYSALLSTTEHSGPCPADPGVAVKETAWSRVKELYR